MNTIKIISDFEMQQDKLIQNQVVTKQNLMECIVTLNI